MAAIPGNDPEFHEPIPKPRAKRRFTVIEFLVVIAVIAVLIAFLLPVTRMARPAARTSQCINNLKQIALALHNYEQAYKALPPAYTVDANGRPLHSWRTLILPYLESAHIYNTIDLSKPWYDPANAKALETVPPAYRCPEAPAAPPNTTTYLAIVGPNGCLAPKEPRRLAEITDDHAWTFMVIEAGEEHRVPWMAPMDADETLVVNLGPTTKLHHEGRVHTSYVDGHVEFMLPNTPTRARRALMSIAGNDDEVAKER